MDLFDLFARITLDTGEYEDGMKDAESKTSKFAGSIKNGLATAAKIGAAAIGAAATGISALVKSSVDAYANYEQLVGGVEKLFDTASDKVQEYAARAYETAGVSATEYMEQAVGMAAALVNSISTTTEKVEGAVTEATISSLNKNLEATKDAQEKSLDVKKRAQEDELEAIEKSNDEKIKLLEESQEKELEDYEKLVDEKIKLIDKQYNENLKLVDEEKYNRLQAVQAEIDAINAQQEADDKAAQKKAEDEKKASLQEKINNAKDSEERQKAQADLDKYLAELETKRIEESRKARIEELKTKKDEIKQEAEDKKTELKNQRDEEVAAEKEKAAAKIKEMKSAHADELNELKEANSAQIKELKRSQEDELQAIKDSNEKKLAAMKDYIAEQKKLVTDGTTTVIDKTSENYELAADIIDMAMTDMSDNFNTFGSTPLEEIQNAYQNFSKGQFQLLDNLRLGYSGSKEEMERLLSDAEKISGVKYDISSYADMIQAIHVIQTEMHISGISAEEAAEAVANGTMTEEEAFKAMGTTAREASTTISGSFNAAKAAWENLVTGIADKDADLDGLIDNLVKKVTVAAGNVMPVAEKALDGVAQLIEGVLPIVAEALPNVISEVLPDLMNAAISFVSVLGTGISENLEPLMNSAFEIVNSLMNFIVENAPKLIDASFNIIEKLGDGLAENAPNLISSATDVILTLAEKLTDPENLNKMLAAGLEIITSVGTSLIENVGKVTEKVPEIIQNLVDFLTNPDSIEDIMNAGLSLVTSLLDNMDGIINGLMDGCFAIIDGIIGFLVGTEDNPESGLYKIIEAGFKLASELFKKMPAILLNLGTKIKELTDGIKKKILDVDWKKVGEDLINKVWEGLKNTWESLKEGFGDIWDKLFGDEDADLNINANVNGSHAGGLNYVPFDGYLAELHRGERVLTATEANQYSKGGGQSTVINQYNTFGGTNSLADQEKANQRLAAALSR